MPLILAQGLLRQENQEFKFITSYLESEVSLGYPRPCLKNNVQ